MQTSEAYDPRRCCAFVCDISRDKVDLPDASVDVITLIFVLSALRPDEYDAAR